MRKYQHARRRAGFFLRQFLLRNEQSAEILEKMSDYARPEAAGLDIQKREHQAVNADDNKARQSLISVTDPEYQHRNDSGNNPAFEFTQKPDAGHEVTSEGDFLAETGGERDQYPEHPTECILGDKEHDFTRHGQSHLGQEPGQPG